MRVTRPRRLLLILTLSATTGVIAAQEPAATAVTTAQEAPAAAATAPQGGIARPVRIRMVGQIGGAREVTLTPTGAYRVRDLATRATRTEGAEGETWQIRVEGGELRALRPGSTDEPLRAAGLRFESVAPEGSLRVRQGRREIVLPGALELSAGRRGLAAVNEAPLEQYLLGVVAGEGPASFHLEALKALAVAARSYTERNRGRHGECGGAPPGCDLCDTVHCHAYVGVGHVAPRVREAVMATTGVFALYGGKPIDAVYSADCGGRTQNNEDAWGHPHPIPYLRSVIDAPNGGPEYCAVNPRHTWQISLPLETLRERLGLGRGEGGLWDFSIAATSLSGRVRQVRVTTTDDRRPTTDDRPGDLPLPPRSPLPEALLPANSGRSNRGSPHPPTPSPNPGRGGAVGRPIAPIPPRPELGEGGRGVRASLAASPEFAGRNASGRGQGKDSDEPLPCEVPRSDASRPTTDDRRPLIRRLSLEEFRKLLSPRALPGSLFDLTWNEVELTVAGKGLGHAVGLCQFGAQGMALQGHSYAEILKHYYTGVELGALPAQGGAQTADRGEAPTPSRSSRSSLPIRPSRAGG